MLGQHLVGSQQGLLYTFCVLDRINNFFLFFLQHVFLKQPFLALPIYDLFLFSREADTVHEENGKYDHDQEAANRSVNDQFESFVPFGISRLLFLPFIFGLLFLFFVFVTELFLNRFHVCFLRSNAVAELYELTVVIASLLVFAILVIEDRKSTRLNS